MIRHRDSATHEFVVPLPPGDVDFVPLVTSKPLDVTLSTYLAHRSARARVGG